MPSNDIYPICFGYIKFCNYIIKIQSYNHKPVSKIINELYATYITSHFKVICISDIIDNNYDELEIGIAKKNIKSHKKSKKITKLKINKIYKNKYKFYLLRDIAFNIDFIDKKQYELFVNGYSGIYTNYYDNGALREIYYHNNGVINGKYLRYYSQDVNIEYECNYVNGKIEGYAYEYWRDGKVNKQMYYINGESNGVHLIYYNNGNLCMKLEYKNNNYHGVYIKYHYNGNIHTKISYIDGKVEGKVIIYDYNGILLS